MSVTDRGSVAWARLDRLSQHLLDDIGHRPDNDESWYVERDIEAALLRRTLAGSEPQIVVGEAGHGKSTLLWSLHRALRNQGLHPLLVSATWLQRGVDETPTASFDEIMSAVAARAGAILLLDTADLMLHSRSARHNVIDLVTFLARTAVPVVLTTRPMEGQSLPPNLGHKTTLGPFSSNSELPTAIEALTVEFIADDSVMPAHPVSAIQSARARGALVDDVCTSPLLLRLLFSLSAPHFPQLELDVTGLYNLFWSRRIVSDHRSGPEVPAEDTDDLSAAAGFLAIAMLALGTPEPPLDVLVRRAAQVAASTGHACDDIVLRRHVRALTRRGVLITTDNRARFLHQTFFEFAAAKGLAARGAEDELPRLIARVSKTPDDLFVGAVVEQTLIILGADALARPAVRASCRTLIGTGHPHPISIAMTAWAHHPAILELTTDMIAAVTDDQLRRFLRTLPRVHGHTESVAEHLHRLWLQRPELRTAIATTAAYLVGQGPDAIAALVRRTGMYAELAATHQNYLRSNNEPRTLLLALASVAPDLVRNAVLEVIAGLTAPVGRAERSSARQGKNTIARYLHTVAESWTALCDNNFLAALEDSVRPVPTGPGDVDAGAICDALAAVVAADIRRGYLEPGWERGWLKSVNDVCAEVEHHGGDRDPIVEAHLIAIGVVLGHLDEDRGSVIDATLARLFSLSGDAAPRQLARGISREILTTPSPARKALIALLSAMLDGHLPAEHRNSTTGPELWASVARRVSTDAAIPIDVVRDILAASLTTYRDEPQLFTTGNHLVALAPAAMIWGEPAAVTAGHTLSRIDVTDVLERRSANIFLDHARDRAHQRPDLLVPITLAVAHRVGRAETVADLLRQRANHAVLQSNRSLLQRWIEELLASEGISGHTGTDLLSTLMQHNIIRPNIGLLTSWLERSTNPEIKAILLTDIGISARHSGTTTSAIDLFARFVTVRTIPPTISAGPGERPQPVVVEAARIALLETIAHQPTSFVEQWPTVHTLTFAPRLTDPQETDLTGLEHLAQFLRLEAENGHIDGAIDHLVSTGSTLASLEKNLRASAPDRLKGAVTAILLRAHERHYEQLAHLVRIAPPRMSVQLIHGLLGSPQFAERAQEFGHRLNIVPRVIGTGTFHEILVRHDSSLHGGAFPPQSSEPWALTENDRRLVRALRRVEETRGDLERATDAAYRAIRRAAGSRDDDHLARTLFSISRSAFYRLKAGSSWSAPGRDLCADIDAHGESIGRPFGLTQLHDAYVAAAQEADDARHARGGLE